MAELEMYLRQPEPMQVAPERVVRVLLVGGWNDVHDFALRGDGTWFECKLLNRHRLAGPMSSLLAFEELPDSAVSDQEAT